MTLSKSQRDLQNDLLWIMNDVRGRRVMRRLLTMSGMWTTIMAQTEHTAHFYEGMRHTGLVLYGDLDKYCPDELIQLLREKRYDKPVNEPAAAPPND